MSWRAARVVAGAAEPARAQLTELPEAEQQAMDGAQEAQRSGARRDSQELPRRERGTLAKRMDALAAR